MSLKSLLVCAQALLIQSIAGQCIGTMMAAPCAAPLMTAPCAGAWGAGPAALSASHGPGVAVTSASPLIPAGVSVLSENVYEGVLAAGGAVPFLGTVALEGVLPTAGAGAIAYGCGNGAVAITAEDIEAVGLAAPLGIAGPLAMAGPLGIAGPLGVAAPLGMAGPLGIAGPLGVAGPLGIAGPIGITGCGCGLI